MLNQFQQKRFEIKEKMTKDWSLVLKLIVYSAVIQTFVFSNAI